MKNPIIPYEWTLYGFNCAVLFLREEGFVMVTKWLGLALLTSCFQQSPTLVEEWPLNTPKFQIPIRVQNERKENIKELVLYVSKNNGKTWEVHTRAKPNQEAFSFAATEDGPHWFSIAVVDTNGRQEPPDITKAQVGQKVLVDTKKPELKLKAHKNGDEIQVKWEVKDSNADINSMKLECKIEGNDSNEWIPISIKPGMDGSGTFKVQGAGMLSVRLQVSDTAGNFASIIVDVGSAKNAVAMPNLAAIPMPMGVPQASDLIAESNKSIFNPQVSTISEKSLDTNSLASNNTVPIPPFANKPTPVNNLNVASTAIPLPAGNPLPEDESPRNAQPSGVPVFPVSRGSKDLEIGTTTPTQTIPAWNNSTAGPTPSGVLASSAHPPVPVNVAAQKTNETVNKRVLPSLKIVNKKQVRIDYEVAKFGPSGLGSVEIYCTTDEGQTWNLALTESSPMVDPRSLLPIKGSVVVPIAQEGVQVGYYMVVKSKAGLGKSPPVNGDLPHIRVEVDTTFPEAVLFSPLPEPGRQDSLILTWKATDRNLSANPVTMEWSDKKDGPWNPIGPNELPNTGKFNWIMPSAMPASVYLKLTVRDSAGNTAVAQTQEPLLIDLNVPEVNVLGISAVTK